MSMFNVNVHVHTNNSSTKRFKMLSILSDFKIEITIGRRDGDINTSSRASSVNKTRKIK